MKTIICACYDKATEVYMRPFSMQSAGQATRQFSDEVNNPESPMHRHAEDFALFHIANYTDNNARMEPIEPICLARAHELLASSNQPLPLLQVTEN